MNQLGIKLDYYILNGQGASSEPLGILNTPGIGSTTFGGTATWQSVLSFENALATANADVPGARMAIVTTPGVRNKWKERCRRSHGCHDRQRQGSVGGRNI